ncbi:hypothetical protein [uncultured Shewanella sp.]|uniref:hypothetical protein n=1 Tax=uncultured Shewanella sp. TaxID=173975 RepID=UPI00261F59CC|nr:hypothetical protein [uncultured Shewanella sp.]
MDLLSLTNIKGELSQYFMIIICLLLLFRVLYGMVFWGKKMSKGAFLFLAIFPLISIFPIPPPTFKNVEKAKQEQRKRKEDSGDPPDENSDEMKL